MKKAVRPEEFISRKDLAQRFGRSYSWAKALAEKLDDFGGRFDFDQAKKTLKAGFRPCRRDQE